jgi:hypothetical protein
VNWSAVLIALVPPGVVTVRSTGQGHWPLKAGGEVTMSFVPAGFTVMPLVTALEPKFTAVAPVNPFPLIVTIVPPPTGPAGGDTPLTDGTGA